MKLDDYAWLARAARICEQLLAEDRPISINVSPRDEAADAYIMTELARDRRYRGPHSRSVLIRAWQGCSAQEVRKAGQC